MPVVQLQTVGQARYLILVVGVSEDWFQSGLRPGASAVKKHGKKLSTSNLSSVARCIMVVLMQRILSGWKSSNKHKSVYP